MRVEHALPADLVPNRAVRVLVIGAGGTGSAIVMGLPYLDQAMRVWGHRYGLAVALMDADLVSETNYIRQPFSVSDIGQNKASRKGTGSDALLRLPSGCRRLPDHCGELAQPIARPQFVARFHASELH